MQAQWGERAAHPSHEPDSSQTTARRLRDQQVRGADTIVNVLRQHGVQRLFGIPGGAISPLVDALLDAPEIEVIVTRHEAEAAFAACGHAMQTGEVGVVFVTSGPGATNALTGVASAYCDGVPLVVLVGEVSRKLQGKGALQDGSAHALNVVAMARPVVKAAWEATDPASLPHLVRRAFATAKSGRRGPVLITLPLDVQTGRTIASTMINDEPASRELPAQAIAAIQVRVERAKRPVILAGNGMRSPRAAAALRRFAEQRQIPVVTSPKGKGVFPESHPLSLGIFGIGGHPSARRYMESGVDMLLALGTSFSDIATDGWTRKLYPSRALVHVDIDGTMLSRGYPADLAVVADAAHVLEGLCGVMSRVAAVSKFGVERFTDAGLDGDGAEGRITPSRALWELQKVLPRDAIYAIDSGEHFLFAVHYLELDHPDAFMAMTGLGSMGQSVGVALGAQLAAPDRTVAVIIGDGGFQMIGTQILDAVTRGARLVVVCMNDGTLKMCENGHHTVYGRTPSFATPAMDVVGFARSLGADGVRVRRTGDLLNVAQVLARRKGPIVLDVTIDPSVELPKTDRMLSQLDARTTS